MAISQWEIEREFFREVCQALVADGYHLNVDTADNSYAWEFKAPGTQNVDAVVAECFSDNGPYCDEWKLAAVKDDETLTAFCLPGGKGYELFNDYNIGLAKYIEPLEEKWEVITEDILSLQKSSPRKCNKLLLTRIR